MFKDYITENASKINCASLSQKASYFSTADEKGVKVWGINVEEPLLKFSNFQSDVICSVFDYNFQKVCCGTYGGSILVLDINTNKVSMQLKGHKSSCCVVKTTESQDSDRKSVV